MKPYLLNFFMTLMFGILSLNICNAQTPYSFSYNGANYEIIMEKKNWEDAAAYAAVKGGHLVHINSIGEQSAVYDAIIYGAKIPSTYVTVMDGGGIAYVWTGGTDKLNEGEWFWDGANSGTSTEKFWMGQGAAGAGGGSAVNSAYINWGGSSTATIKEPDDYGSYQDGAAIALSGWPNGTTLLGITGEWNDISISNELYFVIEYVPSSTSGLMNPKTIEIYPNPASDMLFVHSQDEISYFQLFDCSGKLVLEMKNLRIEEEIDLSSLTSGFYQILIFTEHKKITKKLLIK